MDIDIVLPWVDGSDKRLKIKRDRVLSNWSLDRDLNSVDRFRDTDILKYSLASIKKFAPWVHRVYLLTDGQKPSWFQEDETFKIVDHTDFIPKKYLPTFNSNVIELNAFRIKGLSEHFILFNDDMILNRPVAPTDFFSTNGLPKDIAIYSMIPADNHFSHIIMNNVIVINKYFDKWKTLKKNWIKYFSFKYGALLLRSCLSLPWNGIVGFYNPHTPISYCKQNFTKLWELEPILLDRSSQNKFRTKSDVSHWVVRYYQLQSGAFSPRKASFSKFYEQSQTTAIVNDILHGKHALLCINDSDSADLDKELPPILNALDNKFSMSK